MTLSTRADHAMDDYDSIGEFYAEKERERRRLSRKLGRLLVDHREASDE